MVVWLMVICLYNILYIVFFLVAALFFEFEVIIKSHEKIFPCCFIYVMQFCFNSFLSLFLGCSRLWINSFSCYIDERWIYRWDDLINNTFWILLKKSSCHLSARAPVKQLKILLFNRSNWNICEKNLNKFNSFCVLP